MKKFFLLFFVLVSIVSCAKEDEYLIMGTNATFPPFEYVGGSDGEQVIGFDVAIGQEIAKALGKELKVEDMDFDALIPALTSGKIDIAISGMTITDERKKNVDFSEPYYEASQMVLIRANDNSFADIKTAQDLGMKKSLGAQLGTTGSIVAAEIAKGKTVSELKSYELVVMELVNGKIDAVIIDKEPAKAFMSKNDNLANLDIDFPAEYYGVAIKKGNQQLLDIVNKTLDELKTSGKYEEFVEEYIQNYSAQ